MKRIILLSTLFTLISISLYAQNRGGHRPQRGNQIRVNIHTSVGTRPGCAPVVVPVYAPAPVCAPTPVYAPVHACAPAPVYIETLNDREFSQALNSISNQSFDDGKLCVANQVMSYNHLYSWQVREIISRFTFDSGKLQFAKLAYGKTIDKENYYIVNDAFTFQSSVRELNAYLY